ncbi:Hsp70 family protein [Candidatus Chloroploca sp. M-50]|uniref:Hsp70 family protein n=1 Tax=Candidatus Chloroploca mongolica TaxID=2528176 RepID=A0ABS4D972_9CHLR|nr:Hsp70 family protein [Candidatus Chloroploca mongolica]MBP1465960.1 Hsp70 family protein [Candidatus Chloroploca mongolica]
MSIIVGVDLGTTFSAVALVRDGTPVILASDEERIMPSVVGLGPDEQLLVGTPARNQYVLYPERTIRSIKRQMGQDIQVELGSRSYTPQQISALILREMKRVAESQLGTPVERAVITVPAYFSDAARQATREAGEIAGFTVERIINEPTAAALAYGLDRNDERQMVAVYDLGGGTFDVSIIELDSGVIEVRSSHGNTQLGGDDFDERLRDLLIERFVATHEVDVRQDTRAMARLLRVAEETKIELSSRPFVKVQVEYLMTVDGKALHLETEIQRTEFEEVINDLIEGTIQSLDDALKDAQIRAEQLDKVLFVGGSTRIPLVWEMVRSHTGIEPAVAINPDEAVALGAAVQAAIIAGEPLDAILVDVTSHSLGIEIADYMMGQLVTDIYSVIIPRNTTVPTSRSEIYVAMHPTQTAINLKIYQGEHATASKNTLLGEFMFEDLRPEIPGEVPRITVQFDFDINGILHVSAVDRGSGKKINANVRAAHARLSPAEIAGARVGLEELEAREITALLENFEDEDDGFVLSEEAFSLLEKARTALEANPEHADLAKAVADLERVATSGDEAAIDEAADALLDLLYELED